MAVWSQTKAKIQTKIITLFRRLAGTSPTGNEKTIISDAINEALQKACLDSGVSRWRFIQSDCTATTTSGTEYVDLDENVFNVISGTVRIEGDSANLYESELEALYSSDPGRESTGRPLYYAVDASSDAETIRLRLSPIPDDAYTLDFVAETLIDEDSVSSFPAWMHSMIIDLATSISLKRLALGDPEYYYAKYKEARADAKASQGTDGPQHVRRVHTIYVGGLESRIS